ncbi:MAG: DUF1588 domain-containing protein [Myxococcota bacterium]|nr:DUF1588 domain-containing protein [Myxococcota bacterium]
MTNGPFPSLGASNRCAAIALIVLSLHGVHGCHDHSQHHHDEYAEDLVSPIGGVVRPSPADQADVGPNVVRDAMVDSGRTGDGSVAPMTRTNSEDASTAPVRDATFSMDAGFMEEVAHDDAGVQGSDAEVPVADAQGADADVRDADALDIDAAEPMDGPDLTDPLDIAHDELFRCNPEAGPTTQPRVWRLSSRQYSRLMSRILNQDYPNILGVSNPFDGLHSGQQFSNPANAFGMDEPTFDLVMQSAEAASIYLTSQQGSWRLPECANVDAPEDQEGCWRITLERLAALAWRRPPHPDEVEDYLTVLRRSADQLNHGQTIALLVRATLVSPHTLFRTEIGRPDPQDASRRILLGYELADALNYAVRDEPPSDRLTERVQAGQLDTVDDIRAALDELLDEAEGTPNINRFFSEFFDYAKATNVFKDPVAFPGVDQGALVRETNYTIASIVHDGGRLFENMLLSRRYVEDVPLSCPSCIGSEELGIAGDERLLNAQERAGILTHPSWLIAFSRNDETDPVGRGYFIRERILCTQVPSIPVDVIPQLPDAEMNQTMRDKLSAHTDQPCLGCHTLMDPLGLTFEMFDHVGEYQMTDQVAIDPSGSLVGAGEVDGPVRNAVELSERLAQSTRAQQCHVRTTFRYWFGRNETVDDACTIAALWTTYLENDGDFRAVLTALLTADAWRLRRSINDGGDAP